MRLYRDESSDHKRNAQRNLMGRTHYVDDDTLRFHKSRVLSATVEAGGLLFAIIESCAATYDGSKRGFRPVIFDLFGNTLPHRRSLDNLLSSKAAAQADRDAILATLDAKQINLDSIDRQRKYHAEELDAIEKAVREARP